MSEYRTEFMDEVARIVKEVNEMEPLDHSDFWLGATEGKQRMSHAIGLLLAGTDTDPQTNDQWEAEVDDLTAKLKKANEQIEQLERLRREYQTENQKLRKRLDPWA